MVWVTLAATATGTVTPALEGHCPSPGPILQGLCFSPLTSGGGWGRWVGLGLGHFCVFSSDSGKWALPHQGKLSADPERGVWVLVTKQNGTLSS